MQNKTRHFIKLPIVIGNNRIRGKAIGAMVYDEAGQDNLGKLRSILRDEARSAGVDPTAEWLTLAVKGLLSMYEEAHEAWVNAKNGCTGHVFEAGLPSGKAILMGDSRTLALLP
ncbi:MULTISPECIES: hypothetical protein [Herbaspirillum]|uniref:Uncharacterized protein n=2 Tax=Herbaspirillum huttiense TaxID=863372 RepID=A0AAJ2HAZ8_9BURK|nr:MULTISPECIES: hypothetical protein [Herbaspirillum]MDR9836785.1 hypothetical protein [Herbaspirillum huttiense]